uniref:Photosystem II protein M n=1 Tax=Rumex japonicus TaxID=174651 RepID=A0A6B9BP67_9CARY|nr:photosystem II protein M [Rumex japonicus]
MGLNPELLRSKNHGDYGSKYSRIYCYCTLHSSSYCFFTYHICKNGQPKRLI